MAVYNNVSVKRVIAKVFSHNDLQEGTHRVSDFINWAGEAIEKIGAMPAMINKVTGKDNFPLVEITDYQARLPYDFHRLSQIAYAPTTTGPYYPMRTATGSFERERPDVPTVVVDPEVVASTSDLIILAMSLYDLTYVEALVKINSEPDTRSLLNGLLVDENGSTSVGSNTFEFTGDYVYTIRDSWIKTNVETGYLVIAYQAIPVDPEGYPMVPDSQAFIDALYWYITMKLLYPKWVAGQVRDVVYYEAKRSWNYYCKQAYGDAMMPDTDQMESVKNAWLELIPNINQHNEFFSTLGQQEVIYNHNRT